MEASLYDKIMDQQRLEPEFFRVGFYGKKFPFFLRVKKLPIKKERVLSYITLLHCEMTFSSDSLPYSDVTALFPRPNAMVGRPGCSCAG